MFKTLRDSVNTIIKNNTRLCIAKNFGIRYMRIAKNNDEIKYIIKICVNETDDAETFKKIFLRYMKKNIMRYIKTNNWSKIAMYRECFTVFDKELINEKIYLEDRYREAEIRYYMPWYKKL